LLAINALDVGHHHSYQPRWFALQQFSHSLSIWESLVAATLLPVEEKLPNKVLVFLLRVACRSVPLVRIDGFAHHGQWSCPLIAFPNGVWNENLSPTKVVAFK
jgi:hypothetical protein